MTGNNINQINFQNLVAEYSKMYNTADSIGGNMVSYKPSQATSLETLTDALDDQFSAPINTSVTSIPDPIATDPLLKKVKGKKKSNVLGGVGSAMDMANMLKGENIDEVTDTDPSKLSKAGAIANVAGIAADIGKGFIKHDENTVKHGVTDTSTTDMLSSGAMMLGPVGAIVGGAMKVGSLASQALESSVDYNEYGESKQSDIGAQVLSSGLDFLSTGDANRKMQDRIEGSTAWDKAKGYIPFFGGYAADKDRDELGAFMRKSDDSYKARLAESKENKADISDSKQRYMSTIMEANSIYGRDGSMRVALRGGIIPMVLETTIPREEIIVAPYKNNKEVNIEPGIKALLKGGTIIPAGVLHSEKNNIGDRGLPLVYNGYKLMEIEKNEAVFGDEITQNVEELRSKYKKTGDKKYIKEIGKLISKEFIDNTYSHAEEFKCLNDNTCSI